MTTQPSYFSTKLFGLLVVLSFVASPLLTSAQTSWSPPSGPPPNNNAPAPIHKGSTGQAKYFSNSAMPPFSIGALGLIAEGVFSDFVRADELGVAAKQFCLMTSPGGESEDYFPGSGSNTFEQGVEEGFLDCIDASTGWGSGGGNTQSGLPTATAGQTLFYNSNTQQWEASEFFRSFNGGVGSGADNIRFGTALPGPSNDTPVSLSLTGSLAYMNPDQPASFYYGKVLGNPGPVDGSLVGAVSWLDPATLGIGGSSLPNGTFTLPKMDILTWNSATSQWVPVATGQGQNKGYHTTYGFFATKGFAFAGSTAETGCKNYDTVSIQTVGTGADTYHRILCNDFIRVTYNPSGNTTNGADEIRFKTPNAVFTKLAHDAEETRPVCAEQDGDVVLCGNLATGQWVQDQNTTTNFTVPAGVYEVNVELVGGGAGGGAGGFGASLNLVNQGESAVWDDIFAGGGGGGGGGRGESVIQTVSVIPGQQYQVVVGKGGRGGCPQRQNISQWWSIPSFVSHSYCGENAWNPNGNNAPWNGKGENGQDSSFSCVAGASCTSNVSITADGGYGGGLGGTIQWYSPGGNPGSLDESGILGGSAGANGNGSVTASMGQNGNVYWNSLLSNDPQGGLFACTNSFGNNIYSFIYAGGDGGTGSDGYVGGANGNSSFGFPLDVSNCNPYNISFSGHGGTGGTGVSNGHGGSGGGGGNSQHPGNISQSQYGTSGGYGYGGVGGKGRDGKVVITW